MKSDMTPQGEAQVMFMLGTIGTKLDLHMESTKRIEQRLDNGLTVIDGHTDALKDLKRTTQGQDEVLGRIVKRQDELRTAITRDAIVDGIVDGARRWSPVIGILTLIVGGIFSAYAWFAHLHVVGVVLKFFRGES